ncbi:hypothetical protein PMM47T1_22727 [Pseudomonas sp. M47T1]|nr:hypothetical protein [Pseudomonas sp. M47T1]EIK94252.1 hypothetical protein PMM47T1_22727 [Pseudomonas sp. M47T1]
MDECFTDIVNQGFDAGIRFGESVDGLGIACAETPPALAALVDALRYRAG